MLLIKFQTELGLGTLRFVDCSKIMRSTVLDKIIIDIEYFVLFCTILNAFNRMHSKIKLQNNLRTARRPQRGRNWKANLGQTSKSK